MTVRFARHFREEEDAPKAEKLGVKRYLLAVSHALSRADKSKLAESMSPHVKSDSDAFGAEDLNQLLEEYPEVMRRHFKLWLTSAHVSYLDDGNLLDLSIATTGMSYEGHASDAAGLGSCASSHLELPEQALSEPIRLMAYAMTYARHEEMQVIRRYVCDDDCRAALD